MRRASVRSRARRDSAIAASPGRDPAPCQRQRLDGTGAGGGRGQLVGQHRVGRALGEVGGAGPAQVPAGGEPDPGEPEHAATPSSGSSSTTATTMTSACTTASSTSGRASRRVSATASTSVVPRAVEVAGRRPARPRRPAGRAPGRGTPRGPGPRSARRTGRRPPRVPGEQICDAAASPGSPRRAGRPGDGVVPLRGVVRAGDRVDRSGRAATARQPGDRGERVEREHDGDGAPVPADQPPRRPADRRRIGDGQVVNSHRHSPAVTRDQAR